MNNDDQYLPLESNGPAYTKSEERHGVPLNYVGQKLRCAIEELNRVARQHPELQPELRATMHYLLVAHLGLHNRKRPATTILTARAGLVQRQPALSFQRCGSSSSTRLAG